MNSLSKGQFEILKEIKIIRNDAKSVDYLLQRLFDLAKNHQAFKIETKLNILAKQIGVNIIYLPKFYLELSPLEEIWAHEKQYIRKKTD